MAEPGWTMWMVSHFHYDPIWWNTQGQFTEARLSLPDEDGRLPDVRTAFELVGVHLDKARKDSDYKFVLAEIDYLKPYFDAYPQDRQDLRRLMAEGRVEIVGGNYNEPSTNLTSAESTIRNAVYGIGFQRDVFGGDPRTRVDARRVRARPRVSGPDGGGRADLVAWARGPFHQWGPSGAEGGDRRMQFGTEFEWISPDGRGLLTVLHGAPLRRGLETAHAAGPAGRRTRGVRAVPRARAGRDHAQRDAAGRRRPRHPGQVGDGHSPGLEPAVRVAQVHHGGAREFFAAVSAEAPGPGGAWITPQTRDMGPVYTGKDVSYIDTKQAQRAIETAVIEAERLGTMAWLDGAPFPHAALDKAWRLLAYGAHHDGITGVESDQVYLDLAGGWREAWELGSAARRDAVARLSGERSGAGYPSPGDQSVCVVNGVARVRDGMARVTVQVPPQDGTRWLELRDGDGEPVPSLAEGVQRREDGSLAEVTLTFAARDVPALGLPDLPAGPAGRGGRDRAEAPRGASPGPGNAVIENGAYLVTADPARGGTVSITDKRTGLSVLTGPGNELVHTGRVRAAPAARRRSVAPVAQGRGDGFFRGHRDGAGAALPGRRAARRLVQPGRARRHPGDAAVGWRGTRRVPYPCRRVRRA